MAEKNKQVIIITDGDRTARKVVERVAANIGGRCISLSAGNPTEAPPQEIIEAIKSAKGNPVLVMVDDGGKRGKGPGEKALAAIAHDPELEILGAIAVASHDHSNEGVEVQASVDREGEAVQGAVDKDGHAGASRRIQGDTVEILGRLQLPVVMGIGDLGKMDCADSVEAGARITTQAVKEIMSRSGAGHGRG